MTTVVRCLTIDQALLMRSLLEGSGIKACIPDELTAQTDPVVFFGSMNSIRVQVEDDDAAAALDAIAAAAIPSAFSQADSELRGPGPTRKPSQ